MNDQVSIPRNNRHLSLRLYVKTVLGHNQPPLQSLPGASSLGIKQMVHEADQPF
jgi:hypothetical protein